MALRKRSRLRKPQAWRWIHWILLFIPSERALVTSVVAALITPSQCFFTMRATRLIGSSRDRIAQLYQRDERATSDLAFPRIQSIVDTLCLSGQCAPDADYNNESGAGFELTPRDQSGHRTDG